MANYSQGDGLSAQPVAIVGGLTNVSVTPVLDTSAYATGDALSTLDMTFAGLGRVNGGGGRIRKLLITDLTNTTGVAGELWLFNATLANTTHTANGAWNLADADLSKLVAVLTFGAYTASSNNTVSVSQALDVSYKCAAGDTALYGVAVTRGAPTYVANSLVFTLEFQPD